MIREVEADDEDISQLKKEISGQKADLFRAHECGRSSVDAAPQGARSERYVAAILDRPRRVGRVADQQADRR